MAAPGRPRSHTQRAAARRAADDSAAPRARTQACQQPLQVVAQGRKRLRKGSDAEEVMEFVASALMKKMLHKPSVALRKAGEAEDLEMIASARKLFGLDET